MITLTLYREEHKFRTRKKALEFITQAIRCSDGAEQDRYICVWEQLMDGCTECSDEIDY